MEQSKPNMASRSIYRDIEEINKVSLMLEYDTQIRSEVCTKNGSRA